MRGDDQTVADLPAIDIPAIDIHLVLHDRFEVRCIHQHDRCFPGPAEVTSHEERLVLGQNIHVFTHRRHAERGNDFRRFRLARIDDLQTAQLIEKINLFAQHPPYIGLLNGIISRRIFGKTSCVVYRAIHRINWQIIALLDHLFGECRFSLSKCRWKPGGHRPEFRRIESHYSQRGCAKLRWDGNSDVIPSLGLLRKSDPFPLLRRRVQGLKRHLGANSRLLENYRLARFVFGESHRRRESARLGHEQAKLLIANRRADGNHHL